MSRRVTYVMSHVTQAPAFEWVADHLDATRFTLSFILLNPPGPAPLVEALRARGHRVDCIPLPSKRRLLGPFVRLVAAMRRQRPHAVHAHLFEASLLGLLAARLLGVRRRIYTRHYSSSHHLYNPRAVWVDRLINALATDIVAISPAVRQVLLTQDGARPSKIHLIPHGFRMEAFDEVTEARVACLRQRYLPDLQGPVVGVVSRYTEYKGLQYILPAFGRLLARHPRATLVLANAQGEYEPTVRRLLRDLPREQYVEIPFEPDFTALYRLFDVFVHTPIDPTVEAFGQTYVEAAASARPCVFTLSGIASEFVVDGRNALVVPFCDAEAITVAVGRLLDDPERGRTLGEQAHRDVRHRFALGPMIERLAQLYA